MNRGIDETELLRRIAQLPREMPPRHDPWAEIAARIGPTAGENAPESHRIPVQRRPWSMLAAAASLVAALAAGWMLAPRWAAEPAGPAELARAQSSVPEAPAVSQPLPEAPFALPVAVAASEAEYLAAFREFIPVGSDRPDLSPRTLATIETGWSDLRATERNLVAALERDPDDPFLNDRMLELRARQLGFLQKLATLDMENRRLTI